MDMGADLLAGFRCAKDSNDRNFGKILWRRSIAVRQLWIERSGVCLVMVDAVESDAEEIHERSEQKELIQQEISDRMASMK